MCHQTTGKMIHYIALFTLSYKFVCKFQYINISSSCLWTGDMVIWFCGYWVNVLSVRVFSSDLWSRNHVHTCSSRGNVDLLQLWVSCAGINSYILCQVSPSGLIGPYLNIAYWKSLKNTLQTTWKNSLTKVKTITSPQRAAYHGA